MCNDNINHDKYSLLNGNIVTTWISKLWGKVHFLRPGVKGLLTTWVEITKNGISKNYCARHMDALGVNVNIAQGDTNSWQVNHNWYQNEAEYYYHYFLSAGTYIGMVTVLCFSIMGMYWQWPLTPKIPFPTPIPSTDPFFFFWRGGGGGLILTLSTTQMSWKLLGINPPPPPRGKPI